MTEARADAHRRGRRDVIAAAVLLAICGVAYASIKTTPYIEGDFYAPDPGPSFLPYIILVALLLATVLLAVSGLRQMWANRANATPLLTKAAVMSWAIPAAMVVSILALLAVTTRLGFLVGAVPFAALWSILLARRDGRAGSIGKMALQAMAGVLCVSAVYLVFMRLIGVPLA